MPLKISLIPKAWQTTVILEVHESRQLPTTRRLAIPTPGPAGANIIVNPASLLETDAPVVGLLRRGKLSRDCCLIPHTPSLSSTSAGTNIIADVSMTLGCSK